MGYDLDKTLGNNTLWEKAHLERTTRMIERDKNNTCIIAWSRNEGGNGSNFYKTYKKINLWTLQELLFMKDH